MAERNETVTLHGNPIRLSGRKVDVGDAAPEFRAVKLDLSPACLADHRGKVVILSAIPSLDTPVCDKETRRFSEEAGRLSQDIRILTVSMDLPFAMKRWAEKHGIQNIEFVSDHREASFGQGYGVLLGDLRLLARAVFVVDRQGKVRHVQIVKDVGKEPDYDAALTAARQCV